MEVGSKYSSNYYGDFKVVKYVSSKEVHIQWDNTTNIDVVQRDALQKGLVQDKKLKAENAAIRAARMSLASEGHSAVREAFRFAAAANATAVAERRKVRETNKAQKRLQAEAHILRIAACVQRRTNNLVTLTEPTPVTLDHSYQRKDVVDVDFKDRSGNWVLRWKEPKTSRFIQTRLGKLHNNVSQRGKLGGSLQACSAAYKGVTLSPVFENPQTFCNWVVGQSGWGLGYQLDKDLLGDGTIYSEVSCVFIPSIINKAIATRRVYTPKTNSKGVFRVLCSAEYKPVLVGDFRTAEEAMSAYVAFRQAYVRKLAEQYKSTIDSRAYEALLSWQP